MMCKSQNNYNQPHTPIQGGLKTGNRIFTTCSHCGSVLEEDQQNQQHTGTMVEDLASLVEKTLDKANV